MGYCCATVSVAEPLVLRHVPANPQIGLKTASGYCKRRGDSQAPPSF